MNIFNKISFKYLKKNRTRTIVTIIGVILSVSMITAVATMISSLQYSLIQHSIAQNGDWYIKIEDLDDEGLNKLKNDEEIESLKIINSQGYSKIDIDQPIVRPYIMLTGISENFTTTMPVKLISGKLPEKNNEIIVPNNLLGVLVNTKLGSTISLNIGTRILDNEELWYNTSYLEGEELLTGSEERIFTIVGICETSIFNSYNDTGYPIFTTLNGLDKGISTAYIKLEDSKQVFEYGIKYSDRYTVEYNTDLLRFMGVSDNNRFSKVLYSLGSILVCIIMLSSISLIYNAFAISVSERTKQFGLLSSIGATKRQLSRTVFFEAFFVSIIGIPIGLILGIIGIRITLFLIGDAFTAVDISGGIILHYSLLSISISIIVAFLTVLISAYIPSRRATKYSAIETIRQVKDIKIRRSKIKSNKLIYYLFGFQGILANKNFKRNRKQYKSTIISLFVSIVLFISASSFTMYLSKAIGEVISRSNYDIAYYPDYISQEQGRQNVYPILANVDGITDTCVHFHENLTTTDIPDDIINTEYKTFYPIETKMDLNMILIDDLTYKKYINKIGLTNIDTTKGIIINKFKVKKSGKYYTNKIINKEKPLKLNCTDFVDNTFEINIGYYTDIIPMGLSDYYGENLVIVFPESSKNIVFGDTDKFNYSILTLKAEDPKKIMPKLNKILAENGLDYSHLENVSESESEKRNLIIAVNVFSYGFIVLISLIAIANVFNTVTTNFNLRKREFAMLKSVGMSNKEFYKMIRFECMFYGFKALQWGLPISFICIYGIYISITNGYNIKFSIPWLSVLISIFSVFIVVFSSMIYAVNKAKNKNIIDELRNHNI